MMTLAAPLFGIKHLLGLLVLIILFTIFSEFLSKNAKQKHKTVILIFMIMFYVLEIMKLAYITYNNHSFPIYHLPFHLCSLPLYLYPLMYFMKPSNFIDNFIKPTAYSVSLAAGIMALIMPTTIIGNAESWLPLSENILPIISFLYHGTMIFSSIYLIKSGFYKYENNHIIKTFSITLSYAIIAMIANHIFDTDFMMLNRGNGCPLNFLMESSKLLYVFVMLLLGLEVIGLCLALTGKILTVKYEKEKAHTH